MKFPLFLWIGLLAVVFGSKGNALLPSRPTDRLPFRVLPIRPVSGIS